MPESKPIPDELPSDEQLLAALQRAERHTCREGQGVLLVILKEHLGLPHHSGSTRRLQPQLDRLQDAGLIERAHHRSLNLWKLTSPGRTRLNSARRAGQLESLPESPQHRMWARAQHVAAERITELESDLRRTLDQAAAMLDTTTTTSDAWFEIIPRLNNACRRLAAATHILNEWAEPDDSRPDIDRHPQLDRRNIQASDS